MKVPAHRDLAAGHQTPDWQSGFALLRRDRSVFAELRRDRRVIRAWDRIHRSNWRLPSVNISEIQQSSVKFANHRLIQAFLGKNIYRDHSGEFRRIPVVPAVSGGLEKNVRTASVYAKASAYVKTSARQDDATGGPSGAGVRSSGRNGAGVAYGPCEWFRAINGPAGRRPALRGPGKALSVKVH